MSLLDRTNFYLTQASHDEQVVRSSIEELRHIIQIHNEKYYHTADPVISDGEYDQLFALLQTRENQYPDLITPESPTQRLVGQKSDGFVSKDHVAPMVSLQNTYSAEDIRKRDEGLRRIQKKQTIADRTYIVEPKLDGMSVEIVYEQGMFIRAVTRGDGTTGEDITDHVRHIPSLPKQITALKYVAQLSLRGEIVLSKQAFSALSETLTTSGGQFANARNATAGTLRQLDTTLVKKRGLELFVYDILYIDDTPLCTNATQQFALFRERGVPFFDWMRSFSTIEEVVAFCGAQDTQTWAESQCIGLDGLVVKLQEFVVREHFGSTNHHPKRAIAYKFPAQQMHTRLEDVSFQVGRTGILTPVAHLSPIQLGGVTIKKATLHNWAFITDRDLRLGDQVIIQRSGEVIPYIVGNIHQARTGAEQPISLPSHCPSCDHDVYLDDRALALWCGNSACPAQRKQRLEHAVGKSCLDIAGLGPSLIEMLVDTDLVETIADLYALFTPEKKQLLRGLPGIADKKIALIEQQLQQALPLRRIIHAASIRHIGEVSARDLHTGFTRYCQTSGLKKTLASFFTYCADTDLLRQLHGFGDEMVTSVTHFFTDDKNKELFRRFDLYSKIDWDNTEQEVVSGLLSGIRLVVTGSFDLPRDSLIDYLRLQGAVVQTTITQETTLLLTGSGGGSKRQLAAKYGIRMISFEELCATYSLPHIQESFPSISKKSSYGSQTSFF